jgi:hypothetical protein
MDTISIVPPTGITIDTPYRIVQNMIFRLCEERYECPPCDYTMIVKLDDDHNITIIFPRTRLEKKKGRYDIYFHSDPSIPKESDFHLHKEDVDIDGNIECFSPIMLLFNLSKWLNGIDMLVKDRWRMNAYLKPDWHADIHFHHSIYWYPDDTDKHLEVSLRSFGIFS